MHENCWKIEKPINYQCYLRNKTSYFYSYSLSFVEKCKIVFDCIVIACNILTCKFEYNHLRNQEDYRNCCNTHCVLVSKLLCIFFSLKVQQIFLIGKFIVISLQMNHQKPAKNVIDLVYNKESTHVNNGFEKFIQSENIHARYPKDTGSNLDLSH